MPEQLSLTIDDVEGAAPEGATILEAALASGIDIPHLCYDPDLGLPPSSSCRLCLVEVQGARSLVASCSQAAASGMVVRTNTDPLREMRKMTVELLLSDHPHDCLTCEKAGACDLQKYAYELGVKAPSFPAEPVAVEPVQDGPAIVYDRSKCILCGRCLEICHNVQGSGAIDFHGRGFDTRVALPAHLAREHSTCVECGNCIDVCPTGALTYAGAQGAGRAWELARTHTTCPYCGCGCTLVLHTRDHRIVKVTGEPGLGISKGMLCVKGRFGFDFLAHAERLTEPLIRRNGELTPASWDEALDYVARRLGEIKADAGADAIGVLSSAKCTNEENFLMMKLARAAIGTNNVDHCARLCHASTVAGLAAAFGSGAMTNSIPEVSEAECILITGSNTIEQHPLIGTRVLAAKEKGATLIIVDPRETLLSDHADFFLRQRPGTDVAWLNGFMNVIVEEGLHDRDFIAERTDGFDELAQTVAGYTPEKVEAVTGIPADDLRQAARAYAKAGSASILYSMGITQHTSGTDNVKATANLAMLTGNIGKASSGVNPLRGQNNVQGACDMGALPNVYSGYQKVTDADMRAKFEAAWGGTLPADNGLTLMEMMNAAADGQLRAMYIMGENPMVSDPDVNHVRQALEALDLLVVQDIFMTETAELADVVLPSTCYAEKDGTFTNTDRTVLRVRKAVDPPGEARPDWRIICDIADRLGVEGFSYDGPEGIAREIAQFTPSYGGISYDRLDCGEVLAWPCPDADSVGTPFLHEGTFTRGRGVFHPAEHRAPAEETDQDYPLILTTGRTMFHFHTGTMTRRSTLLNHEVPTGYMEINPRDAERLSLADGDKVGVKSRRGEIEIDALVTERVPEGTVFIPFHFAECAANVLTNPALDPDAKIPELKVCAVSVAKK